MNTILFDGSPQGSPEWLEIRRGRITGSRAKDARDRNKKGEWSAKAMGYAYDLARQRLGGVIPEFKGNGYTRAGQDNEPVARIKYEGLRSVMVEEVGFAYTNDGQFGVSVDGLIRPKGGWECKTMVSSKTLFESLVLGDVSEYRDQCLFGMWLLNLDWFDLTLWCPDLELLRVIRIERDEEQIEALEADMLAFMRLVQQHEQWLVQAVKAYRLSGIPDFDTLDMDALTHVLPTGIDLPQSKTQPQASQAQAVAPDALPVELF